MQIILDTNFLLIPFQYNIDIFNEIDSICNFNYDIIILEGTVKELGKIINEQKGINSKAAKFALDIIKSKDLKIIPQILLSVDDELVRLSSRNIIIATQDRELRKRITEMGNPVIVLHKNKRMELIGNVL
jgi:rRNA-processing protein FCF1